MKKIFLIVIVLLIGLFGVSQPIVNRSNSSITVQDSRLAAQYNLLVPRYNDTTAANSGTNEGLDTCGAIIFTYVTNGLWVRSCADGKKWVEVGSGGGGSGTVTSVATTNGLGISSSVATATTTPNITIAVDTSNASILSRERAANTYQPISTASQGLTLSGNDFQFGGPIGTPSVLSNQRNLKINRQTLQFTNTIDGESNGPLWQFSYRPYSPFQITSQDTISSTGESLSLSRPLSTIFARRTVYLPAGVYRGDEKLYGHYIGETFSFQDTMTAYTAGGDYYQPLIAELRVKPRNNGYSAFRTGHGTGTNLKREEGIAAFLANMYMDGKDDASTDTLHVNGTLVGVSPYLIAANGSGKIRIDNVVYLQPNGLINTNSYIAKSYILAPAVKYNVSGVVDSAFGYFDTARVARSYHAGNVVIGPATSSWSSYKTLNLNGTFQVSDTASYLTNIASKYTARSFTDKNYVDSSIAAIPAGVSPLFPTTGTGTATGTVTGDIGANTLNITGTTGSAINYTADTHTFSGNTFYAASTGGAGSTYSSSLVGLNPTGSGNSGGVLASGSDANGRFYLSSSFDGGATSSAIEGLSISGSSSITYTADTHNFAGNILPTTDDTYTLGDDTHRFADIFLGAFSVHLGTSTSDEGLLSYNTSTNVFSLSSTGTLSLGSATSITGNFTTSSNNTYDIGDATNGFKDIYLNRILLDGSTSGTVTIASDALANVGLGTNLSGTGVIPFDFEIYVRADETLSNTTSDQPLFTDAAHNLITIQANTTYDFYLEFDLTHGAVAHNFQFGMVPTTATITNIAFNAIGWVTAVGTNTATQNTVRVKTTTTTQLIASGANATETCVVTGWFTVGNIGGSIMPNIQFDVDPTGTILLKAGARFRMTARGNDTFTQIGPIN